jgi:hypothetical protein
MTGVLAFAAFLLLPLFGTATWRLPSVSRISIGGRLAVAAAAGTLVVALVLCAMSLFGIRWTNTRFVFVFGAIAATNVMVAMRSPRIERSARTIRWTGAAVGLFVLLTIYGVLTARESCGDLHYFWGPKAVHFYRTGGIDPAFLSARDSFPLNPDYPPLVPLLYVWSQTMSHQFSWWAALMATPLILLTIGAMVRSFSGDDSGALLVVATLVQAIAAAWAAGGGEPPLLLFEALTLCAIAFLDEGKAQSILIAIGLAGAVWTKIEGTTFAVAVLVTLLAIRRRPRPLVLVALPAAILLAAWLRFAQFNGFLYMYSAGSLYPWRPLMASTVIPLVARAGSYDVFWLSWIAPLVLILLGKARRAAAPLLVAILTLGAAVFYYSRGNDPTWWIATSASRVLLTPLLALDIAAIAAWRGQDQTRSGIITEAEPEVPS